MGRTSGEGEGSGGMRIMLKLMIYQCLYDVYDYTIPFTIRCILHILRS